MNQYNALNPVFAYSTMLISETGEFINKLVYEYKDNLNDQHWSSYSKFLKSANNYEKEIMLYWDNLQYFLDGEKNLINGNEVNLKVFDCKILIPYENNVRVEWIIKFGDKLVIGRNKYENIVEPEILEYDIYSLYILSGDIKVIEVESSLNYEIDSNGKIIRYFGKKGDRFNGKEKITFIKKGFHYENR